MIDFLLSNYFSFARCVLAEINRAMLNVLLRFPNWVWNLFQTWVLFLQVNQVSQSISNFNCGLITFCQYFRMMKPRQTHLQLIRMQFTSAPCTVRDRPVNLDSGCSWCSSWRQVETCNDGGLSIVVIFLCNTYKLSYQQHPFLKI